MLSVIRARTYIVEREEGQALVEYALIISLIAVACVVALGILGTDVKGMISSMANQI